MINVEELLSREECENLDFKEQFHENKLKFLHDILCLANAYTEEDRYLVFGVTDDKNLIGVQSDINRKTNAKIQDFIRQANFNRIPTIKIETITPQSNIEIDILVIKNRPDKPFFSRKIIRIEVKQFVQELYIHAWVIQIFHFKSLRPKHKLN